MKQEVIDRLHELEARRSALQAELEDFAMMMGIKRDDLIVEVKAMGWHSGSQVLRLLSMPQEVMDAMQQVMNRKAQELNEVNKEIDEL